MFILVFLSPPALPVPIPIRGLKICRPNSPPRVCQPSLLPARPKTNLIPSRPGRGTEAMCLEGGQEAGTKQRMGRTKGWWLLLRGHQAGNRDILEFHPRSTSYMFLPLHNITRTCRVSRPAWSTVQKYLLFLCSKVGFRSDGQSKE